ncbi:hypothetical protein NFJ02_06g128970 [Pycnococcus provasolii]
MVAEKFCLKMTKVAATKTSHQKNSKTMTKSSSGTHLNSAMGKHHLYRKHTPADYDYDEESANVEDVFRTTSKPSKGRLALSPKRKTTTTAQQDSVSALHSARSMAALALGLHFETNVDSTSEQNAVSLFTSWTLITHTTAILLRLLYRSVLTDICTFLMHIWPLMKSPADIWTLASSSRTTASTNSSDTAAITATAAVTNNVDRFDAHDTEDVKNIIDEALAVERKLQPRDAASIYERAVNTHPRCAEVRIRWSKALSDAMFDEDIYSVPARARALCERACDISKAVLGALLRQLRSAPASNVRALMTAAAKAHVVHAVNLGRLASWLGPRGQVRLIDDIRTHASKAVRLSPDDDFAHHVLGRWELEVAQVPGAVKTIGKLIGVPILDSASLAAAENHFRAAVSMAPDRLIHRTLLAKCLVARANREKGAQHPDADARRAEARELLAIALQLPVDDVNAHYERKDAERMLKQRSLIQ